MYLEYRTIDFIDIPYKLLIILGIMIFTIFIGLISYKGKRKKTIKEKKAMILRRRILIAFLVIIDLIQYQVFSTIYLSFLFWLLIALSLVSLISTLLMKANIKLVTYIDTEDDYLTKKSELDFKVELSLPKWFKWIPFNLGNQKLIVSYGVEGEYVRRKRVQFSDDDSVELDLHLKYKGQFNMGVSKIEIIDTLNLFRFTNMYNLANIDVYPRSAHVQFKNRPAYVGEDDAMMQLIKEGEKFDTREMRDGDSMKRVNWKLYARQNELYVKDSEMASFVGVRNIFYDNRLLYDDNRQHYIEEKKSEALTSLLRTLIMNRDKYVLNYFLEGDDVYSEAYKKELYEDVFESVAFIPPVKDITTKQIIKMRNVLKNNYLKGEIIIITSNYDKTLDNIVRVYAKTRAQIRILNVVGGEGIEGLLDGKFSAKKYGIPYVEVDISKEIIDFEKELLR